MRRRSWLGLGGALTVALACVGAAACGARSGLDAPIGADGGIIRVDGSSGGGGGGGGGFDAGFDSTLPFDGALPPGFDCAEAGITYIYTIGIDNNLYSFYPTTGEFTAVGLIDCPDPGSPFSMAVDHAGVAYVEFDDGLIYRVSTKTAACEPTPFVPFQEGFPETFGMGFVATVTGGQTTETLYLAGSTLVDGGFSGPAPLGRLDTTTFQLDNLGTVGNAAGGLEVVEPELTSSGGGNLYGFFAQQFTEPPSFIIQMDPSTLTVESTVLLPNVEEGCAWAFGFWGGDFYTFTSPTCDGSVVTRYRPSDGTVVQVAMSPPGVTIVGAGVSTCAPQQ